MSDPKNLKLPETLREELARAALLYMLVEQKHPLDADLSGANRALQAVVESGEGNLWEKQKKEYRLTDKGHLAWENWKARWWDFVLNFDVFAGVDLQDGRFASPGTDFAETDEENRPVWEDLRVAVTLRKIQLTVAKGQNTALSPFTVVFLALLSQGRLLQSESWQFDVGFESIFWSEIENIVNSNLWPEELGYEDAPWEEVIDDIITQGMEESRKRFESGEGYHADMESVPEEALHNEEEVRDRYGDQLEAYGYDPGHFYYRPYWSWGRTAAAVGAVGLCWAIFS